MGSLHPQIATIGRMIIDVKAILQLQVVVVCKGKESVVVVESELEPHLQSPFLLALIIEWGVWLLQARKLFQKQSLMGS